jgi:hypothetical protein
MTKNLEPKKNLEPIKELYDNTMNSISDKKFSLMMAIEHKKINPKVDVFSKAKEYYKWIIESNIPDEL